VLDTTCLRVVAISYESFTSRGKKYIKFLQISVYHHSTTDVYILQRQNGIWEKETGVISRISTTAL